LSGTVGVQVLGRLCSGRPAESGWGDQTPAAARVPRARSSWRRAPPRPTSPAPGC